MEYYFIFEYDLMGTKVYSNPSKSYLDYQNQLQSDFIVNTIINVYEKYDIKFSGEYNIIYNLINSMPNRIDQVIQNNGDSINY